MIEQLRANCPQYPFLELVHRLDRDTSGALILAKKRLALTKIQELIRNGHIRKYYYALTLGKWQNKALNIKLPLYKYLTNTGERRVRVDSQLGQDSYTKFSVIKYFNFQDFDLTLVKADLKTGRTHQIRVHLQNIQHPIIGDEKYGNFELNKKLFKFGLKRMFLHAFFIEFTHPIINQIIKIEAPLSIELANFLDEQLNYSQE